VSRGFGHKWIGWVMSLIQEGSMCIRVDNENRQFFKPGKGLRQSDPLSPLLFNLVVDIFTRMLMKAANKEYAKDFMNNVFPVGVLSLQYADDTLLFLSHSYIDACHLKWLMVYFEQISSMKIN
jgi:hypothetical protein